MDDELNIECAVCFGSGSVFMYSLDGSCIFQDTFTDINRGFKLQSTNYGTGVFIVKVVFDSGAVFNTKILKN